MSLRFGIIGLPNVGKSTLFNALTLGQAEVANYAFCTVDPNVGVVSVPDYRLGPIRQAANSRESSLATVEFVDIAGLVEGANRGEGLGNQFLSHVREMDALIHVVRGFHESDVAHIHLNDDPEYDIGVINLELILKDLETVDSRIEKTNKMLKTNQAIYREEMDVLTDVKQQLEAGYKVKDMDLKDKHHKFIAPLNLLTDKPVLYLINVDEDAFVDTEKRQAVEVQQQRINQKEGEACLPVSAQLESELMELECHEERRDFLREYHLTRSGLDRLVAKACDLMDLITFFSANENEARAWIIPRGTTAPRGASKIHSDMERGFIKAEVINWETLVECGGFVEARQQGAVSLEGKDYIIRDGDVITFKFNV